MSGNMSKYQRSMKRDKKGVQKRRFREPIKSLQSNTATKEDKKGIKGRHHEGRQERSQHIHLQESIQTEPLMNMNRSLCSTCVCVCVFMFMFMYMYTCLSILIVWGLGWCNCHTFGYNSTITSCHEGLYKLQDPQTEACQAVKKDDNR